MDEQGEILPPGAASTRIASLELPPLRNAWHVAGWAAEITEGVLARRTVCDERLVLYRGSNGKLVALQDRCAHRWAPLSMGRVEGTGLRCMYHGIKYGSDGHCVELPGQEKAPTALCVRAYPIVERHRLAWVWPGDAARADENLIPDLGMLDDPQWRLYHGHLEYEANYALVNDNLLDLTHVNFLHENTLGRPVQTAAAGEVRPPLARSADAQRLESGVRREGWYPGGRLVATPRGTPDGDLWVRTDFLVPGLYISRGGIYAPGTAAACTGSPPQSRHRALCDGLAVHAVTPMTARRTRYFYLQAFRASDASEEETEAIWQISKEAFLEDVRMIEGQQQNIATHPGLRLAGIAADRSLVMFRGLMKTLLARDK
jgi:phenylpropionate dioxygenase-like ring-hydroxylating dioxygenase large terminal subunit